MSGKPVTSKPVYGYLMDEDENFIIDGEAAPVVKQIYSLCLAGNGPTKIARMLAEQQIPTPGTLAYRRTGNGKIFCTSFASLSHMSKTLPLLFHCLDFFLTVAYDWGGTTEPMYGMDLKMCLKFTVSYETRIIRNTHSVFELSLFGADDGTRTRTAVGH